MAGTFITRALDVRKQSANEVTKLASLLSLRSVLELASSERAGERVAAGIVLREFVSNQLSPSNFETLVQIARAGLRDSQPRVRYRFVEAAVKNHELLLRAKDLITSIALHDADEVVRETAADALARAG